MMELQTRWQPVMINGPSWTWLLSLNFSPRQPVTWRLSPPWLTLSTHLLKRTLHFPPKSLQHTHTPWCTALYMGIDFLWDVLGKCVFWQGYLTFLGWLTERVCVCVGGITEHVLFYPFTCSSLWFILPLWSWNFSGVEASLAYLLV